MNPQGPTVLLCNPWIHDFAAYDLWMRPLGLLSLAEVLLKQGVPVELLDLLDRTHPAWGPQANPKPKAHGTGAFFKEEIAKPLAVGSIPRRFSRYGAPLSAVHRHLEALKKQKAIGAILLTSSMTYWYRGVAETAETLRRHYPKAPLALGGVYANLMPQHAQRTLSPHLLFNTSQRASGAGSVANAGKEALEGILGASLPGWPPSTPTSLRKALSLYPRLPSYPLLTSVGCPYNCRFCATPKLQPLFKRRAVDSIVDEILAASRDRNTRDFVFYDDALLFEPDSHIKPLLETLLKNHHGSPLRFHTPNGLSPRTVDFELARLMKRAGFVRPRLSLESANPRHAAHMSGKVTTAEYRRALAHLHKAGYAPGDPITYILMGLKGQKAEEVAASIQEAHSAGSTVTVASLAPIPGTPAHGDWNLPEDMDPLALSNTVFLAYTAPRIIKDTPSTDPLSELRNTAMGQDVSHLRTLARRGNRLFVNDSEK